MDLGDEGSSPWGDVPSSQSLSQPPTHSKEPDSSAGNSPSASKTSDALAASTASTSTAPVKSPGGRSRGPGRRHGGPPQPARSTRLEAVDDALGPLGPLGDSFPASGGSAQGDEPPAPPSKEQSFTASTTSPTAAGAGGRSISRPTSSRASSVRGMMDSVNLEDDDEDEPVARGPRVPPPVQPPAPGDGARRATQPSVSIEQAAKPTFSIAVGDPHKVGDMTSSHTEYAVRTKTTSKAYRNSEFTVSRRYRDFLWLYNQLHNNNPGVVVPPPPEKQAVGRFDADFIESRRSALERMLNRTAAHSILQHDADLKLFLESETFNVDIKHKERKEPNLGESKGVFGAIGLSVGGGTKFIEHDDWFHDRKIYLDALESQLKALLKATDSVVAQRKSLSEACGDFSASLHSLAAVELAPSLSGPLDGLSDLQLRIRELYERQAQQDVLTLGIVIDEYIRLIGSVKMAFTQRQKAYHSWHAAEAELQKRKVTQDKLLRQGRSQQDRISALAADVADAERRVHQARLLFEDMGRLMRAELERFEREKVEDFKSGVETYLESAVEAQKELIEIWETYLMQLDAEEDGAPFGHPSPPAGVIATPSKDIGAPSSEAGDQRPESRDTMGDDTVATESTDEPE
ncbi:Vps5 C terminal like-domain-containing protein [Lineolata rhizophorae]|uniref:Vps5 C terminal like-domain-containing protein n=1 Tax=Lineolata rhizophorae TaxID=578093 RepID=A0A6A6PC55_9PEZI|nr:Vps5 C terminal like-domain-containing protein [Lineolata rhizophorae]